MKTVQTVFYCNNCGNFELIDPNENGRTAAASRRKRGWTKVGKEDHCPVCSHPEIPVLTTI